MEIWVEGNAEKEEREMEKKGWGKDWWKKDRCKLFKKNLRLERIERKSVKEEWEEVEKRINEALKGTKKELSKEEKEGMVG